jgi:hypothetical protein
MLRRIYASEVQQAQGLAVGTVGSSPDAWSSTQKVDITYCVATDEFTPSQLAVLIPALDEATAGWESAANVNFRHVTAEDGGGCRPSNVNVLFDVRFYTCALDPEFGSCAAICNGKPNCTPCTTPGDPACTPPVPARSFFPSYSRSQRSLILGNASVFGNTINNFGFTLRHELGHVLGFIHEFGRNDVNGTNGTGGIPCDESSANIALTPPDLASVMMYGPNQGCTEFNGVTMQQPVFFSRRDMEGIAALYGMTTYDIVRPNIAESYAPGSVPGDYDGNGVTDLLVRAGRGGNLFLFANSGSSASPRPLQFSSFSYGYGGSGTQVMAGKFHDTQYSDFAIKEDASGSIMIDYGYNGFLGWDAYYYGYGYSNAKVAPADYDGDGITDLSVKDTSGNWLIDYSSVANGGGPCSSVPCFGSWNGQFAGYGDGSALAVPADYDGDHRADLAIKNSLGEWNIDFSSGCLGHIGSVSLPCFGAFNVYRTGYGNASANPIPADYDGDGHADLAIKTNDGYFGIDYYASAYPHYTGWNLWPTPGYGDANWIPIPGKYHVGTDLRIDMAQKRRQNTTVSFDLVIDMSATGFPGVDQILQMQQ